MWHRWDPSRKQARAARAAGAPGRALYRWWTAGLLAGVLVGALAVGAGAGTGGDSLLPGVLVYGPLSEVPAGHWAYRSLERLIGAGLVLEYRAGLLDGERTISRYEAALLLVDAFRRLSAVEEPEGEGAAGLKRLVVERAVGAAAVSAAERSWLTSALSALGREFAPELAVLGFQVISREGDLPDPSAAAGARATLAVQVSPGRAAPAEPGVRETGPRKEAPSAGAVGPSGTEPAAKEEGSAGSPLDVSAIRVQVKGEEPFAPPAPTGRGLLSSGSEGVGGQAAGAGGTGSSYRLGVSFSQPGRFGLGTTVPVGAAVGRTEVGAVISVPDEQWVWARVGRVDSPGGSSFALGEGDFLDLEGIEARLMSRDLKTGVLVGRGAGGLAGAGAAGGAQAGFGEAPGAIAALDGSLVISKEVVVGAAIVKGAPSAEELVSVADGPAVTSVMTRYRPLPWLTLTGEYAQNLWALPLLSAAMQLDATLRLGDLRVGARVGTVAPDFKPAVGRLRPGARVGVDAAMSLGYVMLKAGATRLNPSQGQPELSTALGLRVGPAAGASVSADYELISVEELASGRRPDRSRTSVSVDWGAEKASVSVGVAWSERLSQKAGPEDPAAGLEARASVAYQLSPGTTVALGYRLIDFGSSDADPSSSDAVAQVSVRF